MLIVLIQQVLRSRLQDMADFWLRLLTVFVQCESNKAEAGEQ